jgi:hypothetical protein
VLGESAAPAPPEVTLDVEGEGVVATLELPPSDPVTAELRRPGVAGTEPAAVEREGETVNRVELWKFLNRERR